MSQKRRQRRASERDQEKLKKIFGWIEPWFEEALFKATDDWNYAEIWKVAHEAWRELANTWNRRYPSRTRVDPMGFARKYPATEQSAAA